MTRSTTAVLACTLLLAPQLTRAGSSNIRRNLGNTPQLVGIPDLGPTFQNAADELTASAARALPIPAGAGAFVYRFDPVTGTYERTTDSLGGAVLFLERPQTIGRYVWRFGVTGQYLELDEFDGERVGTDPHPIIAGGQAIRFQARPKIIYHVATFNITYGLTDDLDLNLAFPVSAIDFDVHATRQAPGGGPLFRNTQLGHVSLGLNDIYLRAKYYVGEFAGVATAGGFVVRLPTGYTSRALGAGDAELGPFVYLSTRWWDRVEPHFNAGFNFNIDAHQSSGQYALGLNVAAVKDRLELSAAFLGRSETNRRTAKSSISGPHLTPTGPASTPYYGLEFDRKDYFDLALGARVRIYKTLAATVNVLYALNDDGLRSSEWSPVGGLEATF